MDLGLKDKVALVTGAGSQIGFGKAICLTLAKEGCDVIVNDINLDDAEKTAAEVKALGRKSMAIKADVTKKAEVQAMVKQALAEFGRIDILVNNAGAMSPEAYFLEQNEAVWDKDINLNLKGTMLCAQAVLPGMLEHKYGKIVNISSGTVRIIHPAINVYSMAKAGVEIFTKQLAKVMIKEGINVNCVSPGWSPTNFINLDKAALEELFLPETPSGRGVEPEDIANAVAFLTSDVSSDVVGHVLSVDGGATM